MTRRFQFSIRFLLVATAAVAAGVAAVSAKPSWWSFIALVFLPIIYTSLAAVSTVLSRGRTRVFCIGLSVPMAASFVAASHGYFDALYAWSSPLDLFTESPPEDCFKIVKGTLPILWSFAPINGLLCVFVHWLIWPYSPESAP